MDTLQRGGDRDRDDQRAAEAAAIGEEADAEEAEKGEEREEQLQAEMDDVWAERDQERSDGQRFARRGWVVADSAVDSDVDC